MKNMKQVFNKLKKEFKNIDIKYDEKKETIEINNNGYEIVSNIDMIELSKKLRYLNHKHPKNYQEVYKYTKKYISDPEGNFKKLRKQRLIAFLIALILTIIIGLIVNY